MPVLQRAGISGRFVRLPDRDTRRAAADRALRAGLPGRSGGDLPPARRAAEGRPARRRPLRILRLPPPDEAGRDDEIAQSRRARRQAVPLLAVHRRSAGRGQMSLPVGHGVRALRRLRPLLATMPARRGTRLRAPSAPLGRRGGRRDAAEVLRLRRPGRPAGAAVTRPSQVETPGWASTLIAGSGSGARPRTGAGFARPAGASIGSRGDRPRRRHRAGCRAGPTRTRG